MHARCLRNGNRMSISRVHYLNLFFSARAMNFSEWCNTRRHPASLYCWQVISVLHRSNVELIVQINPCTVLHMIARWLAGTYAYGGCGSTVAVRCTPAHAAALCHTSHDDAYLYLPSVDRNNSRPAPAYGWLGTDDGWVSKSKR